jgi:5,10-methylenetetrahydromethanopterin reductase
VTYAGERFRVTGRALGGGARAVPIFLAASGARVLALAGEVADGVVVSAASSTAFVRWAMTQVDHGAKGRRLERAGLVYAAVSGTPARFRRTLAMTLRGAHHRLNLELAGSQVDQAALARAVAAEDWATAEALVTDEIVQHHAVTGTAAAVQAGLAAYRAAGLDEVVLAATRDANETTAIVTAACAVGETR